MSLVPVSAYRVVGAKTMRTRFAVNADRGLIAFFGKEREFELLLDGFEQSKNGRGQAFLLNSEVGVGTSRLLYEFRTSIASQDVTFMEGPCLDGTAARKL